MKKKLKSVYQKLDDKQQVNKFNKFEIFTDYEFNIKSFLFIIKSLINYSILKTLILNLLLLSRAYLPEDVTTVQRDILNSLNV